MCRALSILLLLLMASPAWPGAWLRDKGTAFVAASLTAFKEQDNGYDYKTSLYGEWGFRENITLGLDIEEHRDLYGHATVFARLPVADFESAGRFAAEFAVGAHHRQTRAWALYKATLSYGKGFQTGWGNGWIAVDAALEYRTHEALYRKLDITAGLSSARLVNPFLQIETAYRNGHPLHWRVRPSVMIRAKDSPTTWVFGIERNDARTNTGIKLAIWNTF
ncbi:hypothetical protein [Ruegeria sp. Ofav3-42]|uniref:hypothetical protein n=1 Tax=Ruegeria sp. Ofav3-42 TaxID=2917759 RepID=UPI001EF58A01|nr:hypothetical protein [Ruegeria sp. Ofav3-42]MCG7520085.1 hypothetical protein [Ruegeria sp. Ofav3-42]